MLLLFFGASEGLDVNLFNLRNLWMNDCCDPGVG